MNGDGVCAAEAAAESGVTTGRVIAAVGNHIKAERRLRRDGGHRHNGTGRVRVSGEPHQSLKGD